MKTIISKEKILYYIVIIVMWTPPLFSKIPLLTSTFNMFKMIVMVYIAIEVLTNVSKIYYEGLFATLYFVSFVFTTIMSSGNILFSLTCILQQIAFILYSDIQIHKNTRDYVICFSNVLFVYFVVNALMLIVFPDGVGQYLPNYNYLEIDSRQSWLGLDNGYMRWFLVGMVLFYFTLHNNRKKLFFIVIVMLSSMLFVISGTGVICFLLMLVYLIFWDNISLNKIINTRLIVAVGTFLQIGIVFFGVSTLFSGLFELLGKDASLTGRIYLWEKAINLIKVKPIFGYGLTEHSLIVSTNGQAYSSHNTVLQILINGGFFSLLMFAIYLFICLKKLNSSKTLFGKSFVCIAVLIMWINGITENMVLDQQIFMLLILVANHEIIANTFIAKKPMESI